MRRILNTAGIVLLVAASFAAGWIRLPYYALGPGPARDVLTLIEVDGAPTYGSSGHLVGGPRGMARSRTGCRGRGGPVPAGPDARRGGTTCDLGDGPEQDRCSVRGAVEADWLPRRARPRRIDRAGGRGLSGRPAPL